METKTAAGCVVLRADEAEPEVLVIWTKQYADPTLPKGHVKPGESLLECALRETEEETGYIVEVKVSTPIETERVLDSHPPVVRKVVHWFPASAVSGSPEMRAEKSLITRVGWLPVSEAVRQMRRPDEIHALKQCVEVWTSSAMSS
jgi:8-oxo-dGTP pyrophosphatase MutT (NUDIX family)